MIFLEAEPLNTLFCPFCLSVMSCHSSLACEDDISTTSPCKPYNLPVQAFHTCSTQIRLVQLYKCTVVQLYRSKAVQSYNYTVTFTITGNRFPHVPHVKLLK